MMETAQQIQRRGRSPEDEVGLLHMSDCALYLVLSNLGAYELHHLSRTCQRFECLTRAKSLWRYLDIREHPVCARKFEAFRRRVHDQTEALLVRGLHRSYSLCTGAELSSTLLQTSNLTLLALEDQVIDTDKVFLRDFPRTLRELSLRRTRLDKRAPFLKSMGDTLVNLHTLILDECAWVREHCLMPISKLPNLQNLSLYGCSNMYDSIAYMSVAARFGFRSLRFIDVRMCANGDEFLKSFRVVGSLREIYMEERHRTKRDRDMLRARKSAHSFFAMIDDLYPDPNAAPPITVFSRISFFKQLKGCSHHDDDSMSDALSELDEDDDSRDLLDCCLDTFGCSIETCTRLYRRQEPVPIVNTTGITKSTSTRNAGYDYGDTSSTNGYNSVTDAGVHTFCTISASDLDRAPSTDDDREPVRSVLLHPVYEDCMCERRYPGGVTNYDDIDKPGCSGLYTPKSDAGGPKKRPRSTSTDDDDDDDVSTDDDDDDDDRAGGGGAVPIKQQPIVTNIQRRAHQSMPTARRVTSSLAPSNRDKSLLRMQGGKYVRDVATTTEGGPGVSLRSTMKRQASPNRDQQTKTMRIEIEMDVNAVNDVSGNDTVDVIIGCDNANEQVSIRVHDDVPRPPPRRDQSAQVPAAAGRGVRDGAPAAAAAGGGGVFGGFGNLGLFGGLARNLTIHIDARNLQSEENGGAARNEQDARGVNPSARQQPPPPPRRNPRDQHQHCARVAVMRPTRLPMCPVAAGAGQVVTRHVEVAEEEGGRPGRVIVYRSDQPSGLADHIVIVPNGVEVGPAQPPPVGSRVEVLCLRGYSHVTDASLRTINEHARFLRVLDVTGTGVTAAGVLWFRNNNPNIRVVHESVCVCRAHRYH